MSEQSTFRTRIVVSTQLHQYGIGKIRNLCSVEIDDNYVFPMQKYAIADFWRYDPVLELQVLCQSMMSLGVRKNLSAQI